MVKMKPMPPDARPMDLLDRWPSESSLTTNQIIDLTGKDQDTVYRWMMRLATFGYFTRRLIHDGVRNRLVQWTITPKGRTHD